MSTLPHAGVARGNDRFRTFVETASQKAKELDTGHDPIIAQLSLVARKMSQLMQDDADRRVHKPAGWAQSSFRVCFALWTMGPLPPHRISAVTNMSRASVSAALKKILDDGLVTKEPSVDDQRSLLLQLTPKGEKLTHETYEAHLGLEAEWFGSLTEAERMVMLILMQKILDNRPVND